MDVDPFSWPIMTRLHYLKIIMAYSYDSSATFSEGFLRPLWTLTQLRGLSLTRLIMDQNETESGLSKLSNLEEFKIHGCRLRSRENRKWVIDYNELLDLKKLTALEIMDVRPDEKLIDIVANMTKLIQLDIYEFIGEEYKFSPYSKLKNLKRMSFGCQILESDPGLEFTKLTNLEVLETPLCPTITQLVHLTNLKELSLVHRYSNETLSIDFLKDFVTLKELMLDVVLLNNDSIVDMKGMTNLMYIRINTYSQNATPEAISQTLISKYIWI